MGSIIGGLIATLLCGILLLNRGYEVAGGTLVGLSGLMLVLIAYVTLVLP